MRKKPICVSCIGKLKSFLPPKKPSYILRERERERWPCASHEPSTLSLSNAHAHLFPILPNAPSLISFLISHPNLLLFSTPSHQNLIFPSFSDPRPPLPHSLTSKNSIPGPKASPFQLGPSSWSQTTALALIFSAERSNGCWKMQLWTPPYSLIWVPLKIPTWQVQSMI